MGAFRRLAQNLGLAYRDEGRWRPVGVRKPPVTPPQPSAGSGRKAFRRLAQNLGLVYRDDGTWRPAHLRHPAARPEGEPPKRSGKSLP
jgi:hypothetical protein